MIGLLLLVLILFVGVLKLIALSSVKITAFAIDFFLIFFLDKIVYIVIFILLAIPVWKIRMEKLNS